MKLLLTILCLQLVSIPAHAMLVTHEDARSRLEQARELGLKILDRAMAAKEADTEIIARMKLASQALSASEIKLLPPTQDFLACQQRPGGGAFTPIGEHKIHFCQNVYQGRIMNPLLLAQILIHEAVHAGGEGDECQATQVEMIAVQLAKYRPYQNGYLDLCFVAD